MTHPAAPEQVSPHTRPAGPGGHIDPRGQLLLSITVWTLALGAVVAAAAVTVVVLNRTVYSPRLAVQRYADALVDHDAPAALAALGRRAGEQDLLLDSGVLAGAPSAPADVRVSGSTGAGSRRAVTLRYRLGGVEYATVFHVERHGRLYGVFDRWRIAADALPELRIHAPRTDQVSVNGRTVPVPVRGGVASLRTLYPVLYTIGYQTQFETAAPQQVAVAGTPGTTRVALDPEPSALLTETVTRQVRDWLNGCTSSGVLAPAGCPFEYQTSQRINGRVTWQITSWPTVRLLETPDADRWEMPAAAAQAEISGNQTRLYDGRRSDFQAREDFSLAGTVTRDGQVVTFTPAAG